jgi:hypothetical protein
MNGRSEDSEFTNRKPMECRTMRIRTQRPLKFSSLGQSEEVNRFVLSSVSSSLHCISLSLSFCPKNGGNSCLQKAGNCLPEYAVS